MRYVCRINGLTHINLTKLDVLSDLPQILVRKECRDKHTHKYTHTHTHTHTSMLERAHESAVTSCWSSALTALSSLHANFIKTNSG